MQYKSLIASGLLAAGVVAETGKLGDAACVHDNPQGKTYAADFDGKAAKGTIYFTATKSGKGVDVEVNIEAINGYYPGPFGYHIHDQPISYDDCATAKAHLDPYQRGMATPCDSAYPATCEVGDLSGKHGKIDNVPYMKEYVDLYASTKEGIGAYLGNRSIVIHAGDEKKTRIACANIQLVEVEDDHEDCESTSSYPSATVYPHATEKPCYGYGCPVVTAYPEEHQEPAYPTESKDCSHSTMYPSATPYPEKPCTGYGCPAPSQSLYPVKPEHSIYPVYPVKPSVSEVPYPVASTPACYGYDCPATTLYPAPTSSAYPPAMNETSPEYPSVYTKPVSPEQPAQYTGSAATFGVSSFVAAVGAIAALVVVV